MFRVNHLLLLAAAFALAVIIVVIVDLLRHRRDRLPGDLLKIIFVANLAVVAYLTLLPSPNYKTYAVYLVPFSTIFSYLRHATEGTLPLRTILYNMAGNMLLFLPTGLLLPVVWPAFRKFWKCLLACVLCSVGIETVQFLLTVTGLISRTTDVDDVILNTLGAAAGYGLYAAANWFSRQSSARKVTPTE